MAARDFISDLPVEVAHRIFETFSFHELLPALGCCRRWRQIVIDCPAYSSPIWIPSLTEGQAQTLALRIQRGRRRPFIFIADLSVPSDMILSAVLPAIAPRLDCIVWLNIYIHISYTSAFLDILLSPASQLTALIIGIELVHCDQALPVLPHNLLQGHAPRLTMAWIENFTIPYPPPAVLHSVVLAGYGYQQSADMTTRVPDLWSFFSNMRTLVLAGNAVLGEDVLDPAYGKCLHRLIFHTYDAALEHSFRAEQARLVGIPHIQIPCATLQLVEALLSHIEGAVQLAIQYQSVRRHHIHVHIGDPAWQRSRCFSTDFDDIKNPATSSFKVLCRVIAAERIVSLTLHDVVWEYLARDLPPLVSARELRIVINLDGGVEFGNLNRLGRIECPALRRMILRCEEGNYYVTPDQVSDFISSSLVGKRLPLELLLEDVILVRESGSAVAHGRYEYGNDLFSVHWSTKELWDYPFFNVYEPLTKSARARFLYG